MTQLAADDVPRARAVVTAEAVGEDTLVLCGPPPRDLLRLLREAGLHLVVDEEDDPDRGVTWARGLLSAREFDVVRLIADGCSNDAVAARLGLSHNTVKSYIRVAYRKMKVTSRSEAVRWGVRHGLDRA